MNGRLTDVIIEDSIGTDPRTGVQFFMSFTVWMDASAREAVQAIPGVHRVFNTLGGNRFEIFLDPRYDREYLRAEIEAQARIHAQEQG